MNIIITGATGYIGSRIVKMLVEKHTDINILTINRNIDKANKLLDFEKCKHVSIDDVTDIIDFKPNMVIHLATLSTSRYDTDIIEPLISSNITFGVHLLDILSKVDSFKYFVNFGTFAEYRFGTKKMSSAYLYSASKSAFKHFLDFYSNTCKFNYINIIPYTVYGGGDPNKKIIDYIVESIGAKESVSMTKGEQVLDFIHIDDVISFFDYLISNYQSLLNKAQGAEIHLGTCSGTSIRDLVCLIEKIHGVKCNINWGGLPYRPLDVMYAVAPDYNKQELNSVQLWRPKTTIEDAIRNLKIKNN